MEKEKRNGGLGEESKKKVNGEMEKGEERKNIGRNRLRRFLLRVFSILY